MVSEHIASDRSVRRDAGSVRRVRTPLESRLRSPAGSRRSRLCRGPRWGPRSVGVGWEVSPRFAAIAEVFCGLKRLKDSSFLPKDGLLDRESTDHHRSKFEDEGSEWF